MGTPSDIQILALASRLGLGAMPSRILPRSTVRRVPCTECGAKPGEPCVGARGKVRISNHLCRVFDAARANWDDLVRRAE